MAYTKILVIHNRLDKCVDYALNEEKTSLSDTIDYALNRDKTEQTCFETAINCDRDTAYRDMAETKRRWGKEGRPRKGYHIIQSFAPGEVTPEEAHAVGVALAERLLGGRYEVVVATHLNKAHLHSHLVFNSVSFVDGKMYRDTYRDYYGGDGEGIRGTSDAICQERGLSVIEPGETWQDGYASRAEWDAKQAGKPTVRELVRRDVDAAIMDSYTMRSFWQRLEQMGYAVKRGPNIKHTTVCPSWSKKNIRLDGLGEAYTEEGIQCRLATARSGETESLPTTPAPPPFPSWYILGRRYRVRSGVQHHPRKLHGFRALYFKYLYLLGAIPKRRPRNGVALSLRGEVIRFDRYQAQFCYLQKNRIETAAQLSMQYDAIQAEIDALSDWRCELYKLHRSSEDDTVTEDIETITTKLRALRRELKLCARIEGDLPRVREAVQASIQDRSVIDEKADKSRPLRHFEAGADVPTGDSREH